MRLSLFYSFLVICFITILRAEAGTKAFSTPEELMIDCLQTKCQFDLDDDSNESVTVVSKDATEDTTEDANEEPQDHSDSDDYSDYSHSFESDESDPNYECIKSCELAAKIFKGQLEPAVSNE